MLRKQIGSSQITVNAIGLGCMGLAEFYGPALSLDDAISVLRHIADLGVDHFDTAEMYGMGLNETQLGAAFARQRDKVVIATKFGPLRDPKTGMPTGIDGSEANCRRAIEGSLARLGTDHVDLYYLHRVDPATPVEDTVGAMSRLVEEGKVRALGLSEVSGETLKRAHAVHPIAAVQSEYSIFSRDIEDGLFPALKETGASLVAYSPLGRGLLTGAMSKDAKPGDTDFRSAAFQPRFADGAYEANLALVEEISQIAAEKGCTPAQLALAWCLANGPSGHIIPGTTKPKNAAANLSAADVVLEASDMERLAPFADRVAGARYQASQMKNTNA